MKAMHAEPPVNRSTVSAADIATATTVACSRAGGGEGIALHSLCTEKTMYMDDCLCD